MIDLLLNQFDSTLKQVEKATADIDDLRCAEMPSGLVNHPAWTLAHLCTAAAFVPLLLEVPGGGVTDDEMRRFGPGSQPAADRGMYPPKTELLARLTRLHAVSAEATRSRHTDYFGRPAPEQFRVFAPTVGHLVFYLLAVHESYHLGQIAQWRRAAGLKHP